MASEVISHAIFASSHLFPPHLALRSTSRPALHSTSNPAPHLPFTQHLDPHSHPYPSAKYRLRIFSCVKRPGSLTT